MFFQQLDKCIGLIVNAFVNASFHGIHEVLVHLNGSLAIVKELMISSHRFYFYSHARGCLVHRIGGKSLQLRATVHNKFAGDTVSVTEGRDSSSAVFFFGGIHHLYITETSSQITKEESVCLVGRQLPPGPPELLEYVGAKRSMDTVCQMGFS